MSAYGVGVYGVGIYGGGVEVSNIFELETQKLFSGKIKLKWKFDPTAIPAINGEFYSVKININAGESVGISRPSTQFIVKIKDSITELPT